MFLENMGFVRSKRRGSHLGREREGARLGANSVREQQKSKKEGRKSMEEGHEPVAHIEKEVACLGRNCHISAHLLELSNEHLQWFLVNDRLLSGARTRHN